MFNTTEPLAVIRMSKPILPMLLSFLGFEFDSKNEEFTMEKLYELQTIVNDCFPPGPSETESSYIPIGIFMGEVLIKAIPGAEWRDNGADTLMEAYVWYPTPTGQGGISPFMYVKDYFIDRTKTLTEVVARIKIQAGILS